ncbi:hypothetical protein EGT49_02850 [Companilactobacillus suantsaicola]|uniref:S-layer protein C-terminal domain-containing protein n=1 Tax=Companilactobacillus suantsaicola TaxID=2487723 RepID=A0A4Z0JNE4_9LACO|nr:SLAP domain-containing protein [Companilactobacillus suantsaicola]TGD24477.1 hypothetical protein EGT49_02850 [Companilactobacillus suantsaicola]
MKKTIALLVCALLGGSFAATASTTNVSAQSVTKGNYAQVIDNTTIYDQNGNKTDIALEKDSTWKVNQLVKINGNEYFQVAPNQFLSTNDSFAYKKRQMTIKVQSSDDSPIRVYNHNLKQRTDVSLASGTKWYSDSAIYTSQGMPFLRVATDQYVAMFDVTEQQFKASIN